MTVTAKDAADNTGAGEFTVTVTPLTTAEGWRYENFGTAENTGDAADHADADMDGKVNLLERAFGTDPKDAISGSAALEYDGTFAGGGTILRLGQPRVVGEPEGSGMEYRALFVRRSDYAAAGLSYTPVFSANLSLWEASGSLPTVLADDGEFQIVSVPFPPLAEGENASFFHLKVAPQGE